MTRLGAIVGVLLLSMVARANPDPPPPPEIAFFRDGQIVASHHFSGPATSLRQAFVRKDGRVLTIGAADPLTAALEAPGTSTAAEGTSWRESQIDVALIQKIERAATGSGICKAPSTPGFSVGGAWMVVLDFGPGLRCSYRRRARLEVPKPILKVRQAIEAAMNAASAAKALHEGRRKADWPPASASPL